MEVANLALTLIITAGFVVCCMVGVADSVNFCQTSDGDVKICDEDEFCCGIANDSCCSDRNTTEAMEAVAVVIFLVLFVCCPVMCYRCCCRRTTNRGIVYSQAPGTMTTVSVSLPPQQMANVPYPTVVPYPQQTPYPPQYPTNPYFGMPPPAYGEAVHAGTQQASAPPSAPYPS